MPLPHPAFGAHEGGGTAEFWARRGLLAPFARRWVNGACTEDPAIVPWERLSARPEGWWRGLDTPHAWWCLCGSCGAGGVFERDEPSDTEEAQNWFEWAAARRTLEEAREGAFLTRRP